MLRLRGLSLGIAFAVLMGAACSSTSSNSSNTGGSGGTSGSTASDCCTARNEPGCTDKTIQACVCNLDSSCCTSTWGSLCVGAAELSCNACGSGSGGTGGVEPSGGAAGANPTCGPVQGTSVACAVPANPSSKCCQYGGNACDDFDLQTCANDLDPTCAQQWTDCCVDVVVGQGLCEMTYGDAGP